MIAATYAQPAEASFAASWSGLTLGELLAKQPAGGATAVVDGDTTLTADDLWQRMCSLAGKLVERGVAPGDVVGVQLPNWWETFVVYGAIALTGAVCNPLVPLLREHELRFMIERSHAKVVVIPGRFRSTDYVELHRRVRNAVSTPPHVLVVRADESSAEPFEAVDLAAIARSSATPAIHAGSSQDIALLMYTSGTTSSPKGVLHHHDSLVYEARSIVELYDLGADDVIFMVSPVSHISGYVFAFVLNLLSGAAVVLQDVWEPEAAVDLIERHRCRFTLAAPVFLQGITDAYRRRGSTSSLAVFMCGGADVPPALVRDATGVLEAAVVRTYGLTEMPTLTAGRIGAGEPNITTDGFVIGAAEFRIDAGEGSGELLVRGPELFCGYLDPADNAAFTDDGFFRTGDLARSGPDGTVTILGRSKDVIVRGGEKISAREVEALLLTHPDVDDVAVVPMPDERLGERVCAFVVAEKASMPSVAVFDSFLTDLGVARQKHPERVVVVEELPRTASGKVQKHLLKALAAEVEQGPR